MKGLDEFLSANKDKIMKVTKLKARDSTKSANIMTGEHFCGQVTLKYWPDHDDGCTLMVDGGWTFRSSLIKDAVRKGPSRWLVKTMNSIYRVEILREIQRLGVEGSA